jgi:hypothetical protein
MVRACNVLALTTTNQVDGVFRAAVLGPPIPVAEADDSEKPRERGSVMNVARVADPPPAAGLGPLRGEAP